MQTHYEVLGLSPSASQEQIRTTYLRLLQIYHPDHNSDPNAPLTTAKLIEAHQVLSSPISRAIYDLSMASGVPANGESVPKQTGKSAATISSACAQCGRVDASLRIATIYRVASILVITRLRQPQQVLCEACRTRTILKQTAVTGILGWWGLPFGPIYTCRALYYNARGGKLDKARNAALLRTTATLLQQEGRIPEARKALISSLTFEEDQQARISLAQLNRNTKRPVSRGRNLPSRFAILNALASVAVIAALVGTGIIVRARFGAHVKPVVSQAPAIRPMPLQPVTSHAVRAIEPPKAVNVYADQLADIVHAHATVVGHHQGPNAEITDYRLDRAKFSPTDFDPLVLKLATKLSSSSTTRDGSIPSVYFNARLMQLSIPIVNNRSDLSTVKFDIDQALSLGEEPGVASWLATSRFDAPYQALRQALRNAEAAQSEESAGQVGGEIESLRLEAASLEVQVNTANSAGNLSLARDLRDEYHQSLVRYKRSVDLHDRVLRTANALDSSFNRCLDPAVLLMSRAEAFDVATLGHDEATK